MKLPRSAPSLNFASGWPTGPYPPPGFAPFYGCDLGNGDLFGLYWPTGREDETPVVCEMSHDDRTLMPSFSSYEKWLEWADANKGEWGEEEVDDDHFLNSYLAKARNALKTNEPQIAISLLENACDSLPDFGEGWSLLASQRKRMGDTIGAERAALSAAQLSSWVFGATGMRSLQLIRHDGPFANDPLVKRRNHLNARGSSAAENSFYNALLACAADYRDQRQYVPAITLLFNYGYAMSWETTSFQDRNGFQVDEWRAEYDELCIEGLGETRALPM